MNTRRCHEDVLGPGSAISEDARAHLEAGRANPRRVLCPLNVVYVALPAACTGYQYVCPHLGLDDLRCTHPDQR